MKTRKHKARHGLKAGVLLVLLLGMAAAVTAEPVFATQFIVSTDFEVSNVSVSIIDDNVHLPGNGEGDHVLRLRDDEGTTLYETDARLFTVVYREMEEPQELETSRVFARLPYDADATTLEIVENGIVRASIDLPRYACTADDQCPAYCKGRDLDSDCKSNTLLLVLVVLLALILSGIGGFYLYRHQKNPGKDRRRRQNQAKGRNRRQR